MWIHRRCRSSKRNIRQRGSQIGCVARVKRRVMALKKDFSPSLHLAEASIWDDLRNRLLAFVLPLNLYPAVKNDVSHVAIAKGED